MPNVLIYTDLLLARSETFIRNPALALKRYQSVFVGSRRVPGLDLPDERTFVANSAGRAGRLTQYAQMRLWGGNGVSRLATRLLSWHPTLIQAHYGPSAVNVLHLARRLGLPLIVYYHGFDATMTEDYARTSWYYRHYLRLRPRLMAEATLFLTHSDFIARQLIAQGFPAHKVRTHYVGIEPPDAPPLPLTEREPVVLFAARLVEKKGCADLISAMAQVQASQPQARLVVVGTGHLGPALSAQARQMGVNAHFTGWQTPDQVRAWMRRARIFCMPSITAQSGDAEGFGMVFIEAQAQGTPTIGTRHGGIPEAIAEGTTGTLVPERDPDALASAITELLTDDARWQSTSQASYERARRDFDLYKLTAQLETLYDSLLST